MNFSKYFDESHKKSLFEYCILNIGYMWFFNALFDRPKQTNDSIDEFLLSCRYLQLLRRLAQQAYKQTDYIWDKAL